MIGDRSRRLIGVVATLLLLGAAWALLAPRQLGGRTSYAVTDGVSMLPRFHADDLVVLRGEPGYHVGEVAGYHNAELGVVVMHRIVAIHGKHYVFKGDNNTAADHYEPTRSEIMGAEWLRLPAAGRVVGHLRQPAVAAVLLGLLWVFSFSPANRTLRRRRPVAVDQGGS